jgi:hypothetical protein
VLLTVAGLFIAGWWVDDTKLTRQSNHPLPTSSLSHTVRSTVDTWMTVIRAVASSPRLLLCGLIQSCFESSMYIFVFMWSPALSKPITELNLATPSVLYHGWVFASFMVSAWCGSFLFQYAVGWVKMPIEHVGLMTMSCAACALMVVPFMGELYPRLVAFTVFELCVGVFWPYMSSMREKYIDDDTMRATAMTLYRLPINAMVVMVLLSMGQLSELQLFGMCGCALIVAAVANLYLSLRSTSQVGMSGE